MFNQKNTELSVNATVFIDQWQAIYPIELRSFANGRPGAFRPSEITGNTDYNPSFTVFDETSRNSFALGLGFSQILHKKVQASLSVDMVRQEGLLSTPFQRVYFEDVADAFVDGFALADDVERLPATRNKIALGGRLHWYLNENLVLRSFYRYYLDDWGIAAHTLNLELPIKVSRAFTLYPAYRFYAQGEADYFGSYNTLRSTDAFYTSDFDLSEYRAHQWGIGVTYTDIFAKANIWKIGLKEIDLRFFKYDRDTTFSSYILTAGFNFVVQ